MPSRNVIKPHLINSWYHLYNRGINKQKIFLDSKDYFFFIKLLKHYLSPEFATNPITGLFDPMNLSKDIKLASFTLMPNHFHLLVKQLTPNAITQLTMRIITTYVLYFNHKYQRIGPLFQGKLKGILIDTDSYLLHLSRYVHRNSISSSTTSLDEYPYSSYPYFVGRKHAKWVKSELILDYFYSKATINQNMLEKTYREFVENDNSDSDQIGADFSLENDLASRSDLARSDLSFKSI
jgi:putative transposase